MEAARRPRSPESPEPSRRGPGSVEPWSPPDKNAVELLKKVVGGFKLLANYDSWGAYPGVSSWLIGAYPTKGTKVEITLQMVVANDPNNMKFIRRENHLI